MLAAPLLIGAAEPSGTIQIAVEGVRSSAGMVRVQLCSRAEFLHECRYGGAAPAQPGTVTVSIHGVPPGLYAAQGFHDADGDGKLGTGWFGIPREGAGFSRISKRLFGKPRFEDAAFAHGAAAQRIELPLIYYRFGAG